MSDRDELAKVICSADDSVDLRYGVHVADAILASDWLAEHVRAKQAEAWDQGQVVGALGEYGPPNPYRLTEGAEPEVANHPYLPGRFGPEGKCYQKLGVRGNPCHWTREQHPTEEVGQHGECGAIRPHVAHVGCSGEGQ